MQVQIVTRHCDVPSVVRTRAEEQVSRLTRYDSRLSSAAVVFDAEGRSRKAEGILTLDGIEPVVAHGDGDDFSAALDLMVSRLAKILRRRRDQDRDHQAPKLSERVSEEE